MKHPRHTWVWESTGWPGLEYDLTALAPYLERVSRLQGLLLGRLADIDPATRDRASLDSLCRDITGTSEIEGEHLNPVSVRSSLARRLGVDIGALPASDRHADGVVDMILDATQACEAPLTQERLFGWHAALFPTGYSGLSRIRVAKWRNDSTGAMQVVSGRAGRQRVRFEAPPASRLKAEMRHFINWVNTSTGDPPLLKAALGHLWFVTLHPFDDGNGRIARAIGDLLLARADGSPVRFYSLSAQIQRERKAYYDILEQTQRGNLDVTRWLFWFLETLEQALQTAHAEVDRVVAKSLFWQRWHGQALNSRQIKLLNRLLDGFEGTLTTRRWASMAPCSTDTALRDINALITLGIIRKTDSAGRSAAYQLNATHSDKPGSPH